MTNVLDTYPEEVFPDEVKGLAPDVHLLVGRHLDLPVALGLVRVVPGVVGSLDGHLAQKMKISQVPSDQIGKGQTSCPSARSSFPFSQFKAVISLFWTNTFILESRAFAA